LGIRDQETELLKSVKEETKIPETVEWEEEEEEE
jgi:hypothetical protein